MTDKHLFLMKHAKPKGVTPPVCRTPAPVERTALPREVSCPACLDWMASNYPLVVAQVDELRRMAR